ncbi:hypothetical protein ACSVHC_02030 [Arthrobacter sp. KNU-44]|uniref:hypothetical protein n=1 Tax=unclassified Arthrobacter TaxID=235627 RepID=UPI003F43F440
MSINQRQGGAMEGIQSATSGLTKAKVAEVMGQLEALAADPSSDMDARLRHDIEVLLAGYKAGKPSRRLQPPMAG